MDVDVGEAGARVPRAPRAPVILLDTSAVIWLSEGHRRTRVLERAPRLYVSPVTLLEAQMLTEAGRLRPVRGIADLSADPRWLVDEPPAIKWFAAAADLSWTRDPFDRLVVAHARVRGWKLATSDGVLLDQLPASEVLPL